MPDTGTEQDSATSQDLGSAISDMLGDGGFGERDGGTPSVETSDAAGTPPAERQAGSVESPASPEGTDTAERAGTPPADAVAPSPDDPPADDPLASATPFNYTVNGEVRPFDGIQLLGEHGAIVAPEAVQLLQRRLTERDHLFESSREQYARVQNYERLSEWRTTDGEGKEQVTSGPEGIAALRTDYATQQAALATIVNVFRDPAQAGVLVDVVEGPNGPQIVWNQQAISALVAQSDQREQIARYQVREQLQTLATPQPQATAPDYTSSAPAIIAQSAGADAAHLTAEDRTFLQAQLPRYVRDMTPAERAQYPQNKVGKIVDAEFKTLVQRTASGQAQAKAVASAAASTTQSNAAKLAAAALGKPPVRPAAQQQSSSVSAPASRASDSDLAWDMAQRAALGRFTAA